MFSGIFKLITALKPSRASLPSRGPSFSFKRPLPLAYSLNTLVNAVLKPTSWLPPSIVLTLLTKDKIFSLYESVYCIATSTTIPFFSPVISITLWIGFLSSLIYSTKDTIPFSYLYTLCLSSSSSITSIVKPLIRKALSCILSHIVV